MRGLCALTVALALGASACGAARAPITTRAPSPTSRLADADASSLSIEGREARPGALMLALTETGSVTLTGDVLEVYRALPDEPFELLQRIPLDDDLQTALTTSSLVTADREVTPGERYRYAAQLTRDDEVVARARVFEWACVGAPEAPAVSADTSHPGVVALSWQTPANMGALVLRRNLLDERARPRRIARLDAGARGHYLDRDVAPGGVYAYRVALVAPGTPDTLGRLSEELYVSAPDE